MKNGFLSSIFNATIVATFLTYIHKKSLQYKLKALQQCGSIFIT